VGEVEEAEAVGVEAEAAHAVGQEMAFRRWHS
jgi:hypothetical protein